MHLTTEVAPMARMEANMKRLIDLGLEVQITELDVRLPVKDGAASEAELAKQSRIYRDVVALCLKFPKCTAIQTWGVTDKYSWVPGWFRGTGAALLFDMGYKPKAAYDGFAEALGKQ
jgi:endo-1,4-beta-xylanase